MHRVVFGKWCFRWFVDIEPKKEGIIIEIQKSRKDPQILQIKIGQDITGLKL